MKSSFRNFSTSFLLSRINCKPLSTQSVNTQKTIKLTSTHGYSTNCNLTNELQNRRLLISSTPILSGFPISKNLGLRNFSASTAGVETLETLSKCLQGSPVDWLQNFLLWTHSTTGLPWWAAIMINAVAIRVCFITPLTLYQMNTAARLENVQTEAEGLSWKLKQSIEREAQINRWSGALVRRKYYLSLKQEMQKLYIRDNCHPAKIFATSLIYLATFICQTVAIRNLCHMLPVSDTFAELTRMELSVGGFGWIRDLTKVDSYLILPVFLGVLTFTMLETKNLLKTRETSLKLLRIIQKSTIVVFPIISILISANLPAAVILSWATNSTLAFMEMLLFTTPKMRRLVGIPKTVNDHDQPFAVLLERIRTKYQLPGKIKGTS